MRKEDQNREVFLTEEERSKGSGPKDYVFVYGTLMRGRRASGMLEGKVCLGSYLLADYGLYDLGAYPGAVPMRGESVAGELYEIRLSDLEALDAYEGNGFLYTRKRLEVKGAGGVHSAWVYLYNGKPEGSVCQSPWGIREEDPVWYAAYGSNLQMERFRCYLQGGFCRENQRTYVGCRDKSLPGGLDDGWFPGRLYFGNKSASWLGGGVAFYDPDAEGPAYMRLYRISYGQLLDIQRQEGCGDRWYGRMLTLGIHGDGAPIYTLTSRKTRPFNEPSKAYRKLIRDALTGENGFSKEEAERYLDRALTGRAGTGEG